MPLSESLIAQARREVSESLCPVCKTFKEPGKPLCRVCYFSLPPRKRTLLDTTGSEFAVSYDEIKEFLRIEMDRGKK